MKLNINELKYIAELIKNDLEVINEENDEDDETIENIEILLNRFKEEIKNSKDKWIWK